MGETIKEPKTSSGLTKNEIISGLKRAGLKQTDVVLVHSAMRTLGDVSSGAQTVVDALLEVIGEHGTLVVPTFTFYHEMEQDPIIDPENDRSDVGIITEIVRKMPNAHRSIAFRHSFAAVGRQADVITDVDPTLSPFDLRSSFGVMLAFNTQVILLGMAYSTSSTSHHFAEWVCDVPYRQALVKKVKVRRADGSLVEQTMIDYQPKPSTDGTYYGARHADFNLLGKMLEAKGLVGITAIGNAVVRRFAMRDLIDLAIVEAQKDYNIFRTPDGQLDYITPLDFGKIVLSPPLADGAKRMNQYQWSVLDEIKLRQPGK